MTVVKPAPLLTVAKALMMIAPPYCSLPPIKTVRPYVPLCDSAGRGVMTCCTKRSSIIIEMPPFLYYSVDIFVGTLFGLGIVRFFELFFSSIYGMMNR